MTKSIAITGHTQGIGSAIYERLGYSGYQCKGYSRSTGWDIVAQHEQLLKEIESADIFVNNAHDGYAQTNLLVDLWPKWRLQEKVIVNISSVNRYPGLSANTSGYSAQKAALSHQAFIFMFKDTERKCRIININPGFVRTQMTAGRDVNMLEPKDVAEAVAWAIHAPKHIEIGEIGIWPTSI